MTLLPPDGSDHLHLHALASGRPARTARAYADDPERNAAGSIQWPGALGCTTCPEKVTMSPPSPM
ncbi:hypothetical protein STENM223S_08257 [Streptomyces tendae]